MAEAMTTLTIKNIPDDLYKRLKQSAEHHRRSLNSEVIVCLERSLLTSPIDTAATLSKIRELRAKSAGHFLADEEINNYKSEGRS